MVLYPDLFRNERGLVQGSMLGLILFILYSNDLFHVVIDPKIVVHANDIVLLCWAYSRGN